MLRYEWKWDSCYRSKHDFLQYFCFFLYRHVVVVEKRKDKPCNHEESINFLCQDNPSYFTTTYINGNKSWPRSCFHCSIEFGSGYKVNNKHPVMMCENAAKHDHECMCAMCIHCYNKMQSNEEYPSRRTRRSRNK